MIKASHTVDSIWKSFLKFGEGSTAYNEFRTLYVNGISNIDILAQAALSVFSSHRAFNIHLHSAEGELWLKEADYDFSSAVFISKSEDKEAAIKLAEEKIHSAFNLYDGPLFRFDIIQCLSDGAVLLNLTAHHAIMDGWSFDLFFRELSAEYQRIVYSGEKQNSPGARDVTLSVIKEHADLSDESLTSSLEYWKDQHKNVADNLKLPTDFIRKAATDMKGTSAEYNLEPEATENIKRYAAENNVSVYTVFLALYSALLYRYSEQDSLNIGIPVLNRHNSQEFSTIGCFVNTLALHFDFSDDLSFSQLVNLTDSNIKGALKHQRLPFPVLLKALDFKSDPSVHPLFQTMLSWQGKSSPVCFGENAFAEIISIKRHDVKFDLLINIHEREEGFVLGMEYSHAVFRDGTIDRLFTHFATLIQSSLRHPTQPLTQLNILPAEERITIENWNATDKKYPETNVLETILKIMKERASSVALEFGDRTMTYGRLDTLTASLSSWISDKTATEFIGVFMERSFDMTVALLSVMRAGKAWVPIDPEYPQDRIDYMVSDSGVEVILTQDKFLSALEQYDAEAFTIDGALTENRLTVAQYPSNPPHLRPDSRAYMIYTSGSTGKPKGVVNTHQGLFNRLYWMQEQYVLDFKDRVLQKTPFSFDVSVWEFFWPLMFGARIVIALPGGHRDTNYLSDLIRDKHITVLHFVPSMLNAFLDEHNLREKCFSLVNVFCSGEALSAEVIRSFHEILDAKLHNLYGPTEAAIDVSYWQSDSNYSGNVVPIGKPVANTKLYVLNKAHQIQPIGVAGELYIAGVQLAEGYHNRPELTEKTFIEVKINDDESLRMYKTGDLARFNTDGNIEYLGRTDHQIKLRGFRIELGEIEAVILSSSVVREAAVILDESTGVNRLIAYVSLNGGAQSDAEHVTERIKNDIGKKIPSFMVPSAFYVLDALPLSANGKLDRKSLPAPRALNKNVKKASFSSSEEEIFFNIVSGLVSSESVTLQDNFFAAGGDSILALKLISELKKQGLTLSLKQIYDAQNIAEMITACEPLRNAAGPASDVSTLLSVQDRKLIENKGIDAWPMSTLQKGMVYHSLLNEDSSVYHDIFTYITEHTSVSGVTAKIAAVVATHEQLHCVFDMATCSVPVQVRLKSPCVQISHCAIAGDLRAHLDLWESQCRQQPFNFEAGPLVRFTLHVRDNVAEALSLDFHHSVLDGWSVSTLVNQIINDNEVSAESVSYATFVAREAEAMKSQSAYDHWLHISSRSACKGFGLEVDIHTSESESLILSERFIRDLRDLSRKHTVPLKTAAMYYHYLALSRATGRRDVCFGNVVNGRVEEEGSVNSLGLYLNTVPFIVAGTAGNPENLISAIFSAEKEDLAHRRYPLVSILKSAGRDSLFDVVFNFTDFHGYSSEKNRVREARYYEQTNFPVMIHFARDPFTGGYGVTVNYHSTETNKKFVQKYLSEFRRMSQQENLISVPREVAEVFFDVTGRTFSHDDNYHAHGVDSISALRIAALLRKADYSISLRHIVGSSSLTELITAVDGEQPTESSGQDKPSPDYFFSIPESLRSHSDAEDIYPLTDTQKLMVDASLQEAGYATYHDVFGYEFGLQCQPDVIRRVLTDLMAEHPVLRTSLITVEGEIILQKVHKRGTLNFNHFDISGHGKLNAHHVYSGWFEEEKCRDFSFSDTGLVRFFTHKISEDTFVLTLSFHHAILDGFSLSNLIKLFVACYQATLSAAPSATARQKVPAFRDYCLLSKAESESEQAKAFWIDTLYDEPKLMLPFNGTKRSAEADSSRWSELKVSLNPEITQELTNMAAAVNVSLKHILLAVHFTVLNAVFSTTDLITSTFTGGRTDELDSDLTLGMFLNFQPVRCNLSDMTFREAALNLKDFESRALPYKRFSFTKINGLSAHQSYQATCFNFTRFTNYQEVASSASAADAANPLRRTMWFEHTHFGLLVNAGFDLSLNEVILTLNSKTETLSIRDLEMMAALYTHTARSVVADPAAECAQLNLLNKEIKAAFEKDGTYEAG